jgi:TonB family protein
VTPRWAARLGSLVVIALHAHAARAQGAQPSGPSPVEETRSAPRLTKEPKLVTFIAAPFPANEARSATVKLAITIAIDGSVRDVTVLESGGADFDAAAVAAARRFVFEPAEVDGRPAAVKIAYQYAFTYEAKPAPPIVTEPPPPPPPEGDRAQPAKSAPEEADEITVRAAQQRHDTTAIAISAEEGRRVAGTQGDTLKVVQNLPGVARPSFGSGQLVVWGAAPNDTRVYVDGVEVPALFHASALRSTINSDLVKSVELVPGAYGADYGRSLGGLVRVETRALPASGVHGYVGADTLDTSAMISAAAGDALRVGVAGRVSYIDRVLSAVSTRDVGDYFPIPRYRDYQGKASLALRAGESLDAVFLGSDDDLRRTIPSTDPARVRTQTTSLGFQRFYLHYARTSADGTRVDVTPFVGHDRSDVESQFGDNPAKVDIRAWRYGVRASERLKLGQRITLAGGVDVLGTAASISRAGSLNIPAREGDVTVFGQPPGDDYNSDDWTASIVDVGPYLTADLALGALTVTPSLRVDGFLLEASRQTPRIGQTPSIGLTHMDGVIEPRLAARWQALPRLALTGSVGKYAQPPQPEDLSAVFGTPQLSLSKATHATFGESLAITRTLSVEVTGFYKQMSDLVMRSRRTTPKLAQALVQDGEGRVYGLQMLLRQEMAKGFFGWASYTISRSERRYVGDPVYRLFDYDQPHVLTVVASKQAGPWTFGARFRYARGLPRTPVIGAFYDVRGDQFQPAFGDQNSIRLPDFYQLDLRVDRAFTLGPARLILYVEGQNVTFHQNSEEIVYSDDYTRRGTISGLPTLAIFGARVEL